MYSKWSAVFIIGIFILFSRLLVTLFSGLVVLPDSTSDAVMFADAAKQVVRSGLWSALQSGTDEIVHSISWLFAFFYWLLGINDIALQIPGILVSYLLVCVIYFYMLDYSKKTPGSFLIILLFSLSPTHLIYSVLPLKEIYVTFLGSASFVFLLRYLQCGKILNLFWCGIALACATILHPFYLYSYIIMLVLGYFLLKRKFLNIFLFFLIFYFYFSVFGGAVVLPKIGRLDVGSLNFIVTRIFQYQASGMSSNTPLPDFVILEDVVDIFFVLPVRCIYFLFGPLKFNSTASTLASCYGLILGLAVVYSLVKCKENKIFWLLVVFSFLIVGGLSLSSGGGLVRHRFKIEPVLFLLFVCKDAVPNIRGRIKNEIRKSYNE